MRINFLLLWDELFRDDLYCNVITTPSKDCLTKPQKHNVSVVVNSSNKEILHLVYLKTYS